MAEPGTPDTDESQERQGIVVIFCTATEDVSESIARQLVELRLVACVNVTPVRSYYRWKGEFCRDKEDLLIAKTPREKAGAVIAAIRELHQYEVPEIIVLPVIAGHAPYLDWVYAETDDS